MDPFCEGVPDNYKVEFLCAFAAAVRTGTYGRGHQVRCGTVQLALRSIGSTCELAAKPNPTYSNQHPNSTTYWKRISQLLEGYRRADPPSQAKLAVPVTVAHYHAQLATLSSNPKQQAISHLTNIAFYYLLRVGEYTYSGANQKRRTTQFRVQDVIFRKGQHIIPNTAPLQRLLQATTATLIIDNQKNGQRGQCIHHHCTGKANSPIKSLAHRVSHIMSHTANQATPLSTYYTPDGAVHNVLASHINQAVKSAVVLLGLSKQGFHPSRVSSHSLRAGGAMALKLHGYDRDTIKKLGRWSSDTFLTYIHEQISAFSAGIAETMSIPIPFHNIESSLTVTPAA